MDAKKVPPRVYQAIPLEIETVGKKVLDAAYTIHTALGPGLLESVYEACLAFEARKNQINVETQVALPVRYKDIFVETGLRLDLWAERSVIIEIKAVEK